MLLARFPTLSPTELKRAHAYAYGGCAIQDYGYYPFAPEFFSNLTHYFRSGDFVEALLREARTPDELAFAIGALSHYIGDTIGHSVAVNRAVPIEFPKLGQQYGPVVTYDENPHAHVRVEFAFDINQLGKLRLAPSGYLRYIGLTMPDRLLRRVFYETYGLNLPGVIGSREAAVRTYRFALRSLLPAVARAEVLLHRSEFPPDTPGPVLDSYAKASAQAAAENDWERFRSKPGVGSHLLAGLIRVLPKVGPLSMLALRGPIPATEELYLSSVVRAADALRSALTNIPRTGEPLPNLDLDTGQATRPGSYALADETAAQLVLNLVKTPERPVPARLKRDLLEYYADPRAPIATKQNPGKWAKVQAGLQILRGMPTVSAAAAR